MADWTAGRRGVGSEQRVQPHLEAVPQIRAAARGYAVENLAESRLTGIIHGGKLEIAHSVRGERDNRQPVDGGERVTNSPNSVLDNVEQIQSSTFASAAGALNRSRIAHRTRAIDDTNQVNRIAITDRHGRRAHLGEHDGVRTAIGSGADERGT